MNGTTCRNTARNTATGAAMRAGFFGLAVMCIGAGVAGIGLSGGIVHAQSAPPAASPPPQPSTPANPSTSPKIGAILGDVINRTVQIPGQTPAGQTPTGHNHAAGGSTTQAPAATNASPLAGLFSASEADSGLRQALTLGAESVVARLGKVDGYFKDPKVKIPLPPRLAKIQSTLGPIGGLKVLDDLQLRMNRAAEAAAPEAKALFVDAIKGMSVTDAIGIVRGPADGATAFMKARTKDKLTAAFRPYVEKGLDNAGAFKAMDTATRQFGATGLAGNARTGLTDYAIGAALDGMFLYMAEEERAIRANPTRQTTSLLKKVFGAK